MVTITCFVFQFKYAHCRPGDRVIHGK